MMYTIKRSSGILRTSIRKIGFSYPETEQFRLKSSRRLFHTTQPYHSQVLDICLSQTHNLLTNIHTISGLPWVLTLPLAALLIRGTLITPLMIYTTKNRERIASLSPILSAWRHVLERKVNKEYGSLGPEKAEKILKAELRIKRAEIYRTMNVSPLRLFLPWLQFPVWLLMIETIRKMSGAGDGLLSLLAKPFSHSVEQDSETALAALESDFPVEQSFSTEGALWFHNLLAPDPQLILPFLLSGVLFANIHRQVHVASKSGLPIGKWQKRFTNALKLFALAIGPLTLQVPCAMLVYWITSSTFAFLSNEVLDRVYTPAKRIVPCKPRQPIGSPIAKA